MDWVTLFDNIDSPGIQSQFFPPLLKFVSPIWRSFTLWEGVGMIFWNEGRPSWSTNDSHFLLGLYALFLWDQFLNCEVFWLCYPDWEDWACLVWWVEGDSAELQSQQLSYFRPGGRRLASKGALMFGSRNLEVLRLRVCSVCTLLKHLFLIFHFCIFGGYQCPTNKSDTTRSSRRGEHLGFHYASLEVWPDKVLIVKSGICKLY